MFALLKMAWRNIWRNKRRTTITLASIAFGLAALLFQQSLIKSLQSQLIEKATRSYSAHIQIQSKETTDPKVPEERIKNPEPVMTAVQQVPGIEAWSPRVVFTGLISSPLTSKGTLVVGIDPEREKNLTIIHSYLTDGRYLEPGKDREIVMGIKLAKDLDLRLGEKAVIMIQASDGSLSAEAFRLAGLFKTSSPVYDGQIVYVPIQAAQRLLVCGNEVSVISARVRNSEKIAEVREKLSNLLAVEPVSVLTWQEAAHEIVSIQEFQNAILLIVLLVVFAIVALGIFNTMLMSLFERIREFGLMISLGAKPAYVAQLILLESFLLGFLGMLIGNLAGSAIILYFNQKGVPLPIQDALGYWMPFDRLIYLKFAWKELFYSSIAAVITSILAAVFPAIRAARIQPVQALRHY